MTVVTFHSFSKVLSTVRQTVLPIFFINNRTSKQLLLLLFFKETVSFEHFVINVNICQTETAHPCVEKYI